MVPEPLSLLSMALGLFGAIISLVDKSVDTIDNIRHYKSRLRHLGALLRAYYLRLWDWYDQYYEKSSDFIRLEFWGIEGRDQINVYLADVVAETNSLCRHLYGDDRDLDPQDSSQSLRLRETMYRRKHPEWEKVKRFFENAELFAMYETNLLKKRISILKGYIDSIETISRIQFEFRHGHSKRSLRKSIELSIRMTKFSRAMRRAYCKRPNPSGHWGLLLLPPEGELDQFESDEIPVAFIYSPEKFGHSLTAYRVNSSYHVVKGEIDEIRSAVAEAFTSALESEEELLRVDDVLKVVFRVDPDDDMDREHFRKLTCSGRASIAFQVATWAALAWQTHWCQALCSCCVRPTQTRDGQRFAAVSPSELHITQYCSATDNELYEHPYLLLGILLAELGLAQPIGVCMEKGTLMFELHDEQPSSHRTTNSSSEMVLLRITLPQLLKRVQKATSHEYYVATNHCFTLDYRSRQSNREKSRLRAALRVEDYESYLEKIIQPLSRYDKTLQRIPVDS